MEHAPQWNLLLDLLQKGALVLLGGLYLRAKGDEMSRDILRKTLADLRGQLDDRRNEIEDRDRVTISQREQINSLSGRIADIEAEVRQKEARMMALLDENLTLKAELRKLGRKG